MILLRNHSGICYFTTFYDRSIKIYANLETNFENLNISCRLQHTGDVMKILKYILQLQACSKKTGLCVRLFVRHKKCEMDIISFALFLLCYSIVLPSQVMFQFPVQVPAGKQRHNDDCSDVTKRSSGSFLKQFIFQCTFCFVTLFCFRF